MRVYFPHTVPIVAEFVDLAGGSWDIVAAALQPDSDGCPVPFETALQRIVDLRLVADRARDERRRVTSERRVAPTLSSA